jgi:hypothetical protein
MAQLQNGVLGWLTFQLDGEQRDRPLICHRGGNVLPLAGVCGLAEQATELVQPRRRRAQDAVSVMVHMGQLREGLAQTQ